MSEPPGVLSNDFDSRYRIERELGRGATAIVYLAQDLVHARPVAIKMLRRELAESLSATRFLHEIRRTAGLQHPHIVPVLDSGERAGIPFCVLPYMDEGTLRDRIDRQKQLSVIDAVAIARTIAAALDAAHVKGLIHRDVKPENILFSGGQPFLADFGIARALVQASGEPTTSTGIVLGTPAYMSPEQVTGDRDLDGRSDIYSLACVLYEMVAGIPAFVGPTSQSILAQRVHHVPRPIHVYRPMAPDELDEVLERALASSPTDRFQTAGAFAAALANVESVISQPDYATRVRHRRRLARRRLVGRWTAIAATVLAASALVLWRSVRLAAGPLDPKRVMVFPMSVPADSAVPRSAGEDAATMIGNALDGVGSLRWIDAWQHLPPAARDSARVEGQAAAIARAHHCGRYVIGQIVRSHDSTMVVLQLLDTDSTGAVARGSSGGVGVDAWRLALQAVNQLLPDLIPGTTADALAGWQDRNPTAIANFLAGEAAFRRARFDDALGKYREAVKTDSAFALAAIRGAQAAAWGDRSGDAEALIRVAGRASLPPRYAHFVRGYAAYLDGRADSAAAELRAALDADPQMVAAWAQLGEVYTHLLPRAGNLDSLADDAFGHALQLDSTAANLLFHPIQIAFRRGDLSRARSMMRRLVATRPETAVVQPVEIMGRCVDQGAARVNWEDIARQRPAALVTAAFHLAAGGAQLPCAAAGFKAILAVDTASKNTSADGRRWASLIGLQGVLLAQGKSREAANAIDAFDRRWQYGTSLFLLAGPMDSVMASRARDIARADAEKFGQSFERLPYPFRLWELGQWELFDGHADRAEAILPNLRGLAAKSGTARDSLLVTSLEARVALARRDTAKALALLRAIVPASFPTALIQWNEMAPVPGERLLLGQLLLARGDAAAAVATTTVFDSPGASIHLLFLPASLALRARAATALGDGRAQSRLSRRVAALRTE